MIHRLLCVAALSVAVATPIALASTPDVVFEGLKGSDVLVVNADGSEVTGKLLSFDKNVVAIAKADGRVVTVDRDRIDTISLKAAPRAAYGDTPARTASTSAEDAEYAEASTRREIARLRSLAEIDRTQGTLDLALWLPLSGLTFVGGWALIDEYSYGYGDDFSLAAGTLSVITGGIGLVAFPISGAGNLSGAAAQERQAAQLEAGLAARPAFPVRIAHVAPVTLPEGGGLVVSGTF